MLKHIGVKNLKGFDNPGSAIIRDFNLLAGTNSAGKSTFIQILLLFRQSLKRAKPQLILNGPFVQLGSFADIKNNKHEETDPIVFYFSGETQDNYFFDLEYFFYKNQIDKNDLLIDLHTLKVKIKDPQGNIKTMEFHSEFSKVINLAEDKIEITSFKNFIPTVQKKSNEECDFITAIQKDLNFHKIFFISAERLGPREFYSRKISSTHFVGTRGQNTASVIHFLAGKTLENPELNHPNAETRLLEDQISAWSSQIFGNSSFSYKKIANSLTQFYFDGFLPSNVGFGYVYTLPIITQCLAAKKGDIVIVENPEAHLHPAAQSRLASLLLDTAQCGVQVIVETHSDHFLSSLRVRTKKTPSFSEKISIIFFSKVNNEIKFDCLGVEKNADLTAWPDGFFDQLQKDFEQIYE